MKHQIYASIFIGGIAIALWFVSAVADDRDDNDDDDDNEKNTYISVKASNPMLIRRVMGPITNSVNGVPAEPVDGFDWAGHAIRTTEGNAEIKVDAIANTGLINADWKDEYGDWTYQQMMFVPPNHATGARMGPSKDTVTVIEGDPITTNIYLHGNTGAGTSLVPTVFNLLATWGPAKVTLNGEPFDNPFDGPTPMWIGHTMLSEGIRDADGTVQTTSGEIFDMTRGSEGQIYPDDLVLHIAFHDMPGPEMNTNIPPVWSFFYQVAFDKVKVEIKHND